MHNDQTQRRVFLALPAYGAVEREHAIAVAETMRRAKGVYVDSRGSSLLARCFNELWCEALNKRQELKLTHFVMLHSDIEPTDPNWLTLLMDEMDNVNADVLSAVSPIKDSRRITSTAVLEGHDLDRLSEEQLAELPTTFSEAMFPGKTLLINTGLMAVRFDQPWVEKCWFEIRDEIYQREDGIFEPRGMSEDWNFSLMAKHFKRRVFATQRIGLKHYGRMAFERKARAA